MRRPLVAILLAIAAAAALFAWAPGLDLAVARAFHGPDGFIGRAPAGEAARSAFYVLPFLCLAAAAAAWLAGRRGLLARAPGLRELAFLATTLMLGPGLLVNVGLKEHSHRPRPAHIVEFGGAAEFRPFWRFDGACPRNCSFVSGEAASAAWTLAPALLVPPPARAAAIAASLAVTAATAALRLAFGGHFLSDVIFAILLTLLVVLVGARLFGITGGARRTP